MHINTQIMIEEILPLCFKKIKKEISDENQNFFLGVSSDKEIYFYHFSDLSPKDKEIAIKAANGHPIIFKKSEQPRIFN